VLVFKAESHCSVECSSGCSYSWCYDAELIVGSLNLPSSFSPGDFTSSVSRLQLNGTP